MYDVVRNLPFKNTCKAIANSHDVPNNTLCHLPRTALALHSNSFLRHRRKGFFLRCPRISCCAAAGKPLLCRRCRIPLSLATAGSFCGVVADYFLGPRLKGLPGFAVAPSRDPFLRCRRKVVYTAEPPRLPFAAAP